MPGLGQSLEVGFRRRWQRGVGAGLGVLGVVWTITEITTRVSPDLNSFLDKHRLAYALIALGLAAIGFAKAIYEPRCVSFYIPNTDTKLTLKFGDIFDEKFDWLIGVNECFDSSIGAIVSPKSLHGQLISRTYGGDENRFRVEVDHALGTTQGTPVVRVGGNPISYPLGTTVALKNGPANIFLVAMATSDPKNHRASTTVPLLWGAIEKAFAKIDAEGNGRALAMPLIGNGRASLHVPPQHLLRLITLIIVEQVKAGKVPKSVTINLADDCFELLDLNEIKRGWSLT